MSYDIDDFRAEILAMTDDQLAELKRLLSEFNATGAAAIAAIDRAIQSADEPPGKSIGTRREDPLGYEGTVLERLRQMAEDAVAGVDDYAVKEEAAILRARLTGGR